MGYANFINAQTAVRSIPWGAEQHMCFWPTLAVVINSPLVSPTLIDRPALSGVTQSRVSTAGSQSGQNRIPIRRRPGTQSLPSVLRRIHFASVLRHAFASHFRRHAVNFLLLANTVATPASISIKRCCLRNDISFL